jgi:hypothetical protein
MSTDDGIKQKLSDLDRKITEIKRNNEAEVRQKFLDEISRLLDEANTQADNKDIINAKITKERAETAYKYYQDPNFWQVL